jgi:lysophospholipase L1-like esterase
MRLSPRRSACAPLILVLCLIAPGRSRADLVYVALGDSLTFGTDPSTPSAQLPSFGDQGFVRPFADFLASQNGGVRPGVINLAIPGEQSTSFFSAVTNPPAPGRAWQLNLNYPDATTTQDSLLRASIGAVHAAGNRVGYASFLIGSNDIFALVGSPAFQNATPAEQQAMIAAAFGTIQQNYVTALSELTTLAPEARVILPIYYNPFPASSPEHAFYDAVLSLFRQLVRGDAAAFGATAVDLYPLFAGRELELTNIGTGDVHPNQAGYALIAGALAQAVPEPSSCLLVAVGSGLGVGLAARRRRAGSASLRRGH